MPSDMDKNENQKFRRLEELILANEIKFQEILQEKEARYQTELKEKDHQIEQIKSQEKVHQKELLAVRKKLSDIYSSYGWKYLSTFYKIINSIPFVNSFVKQIKLDIEERKRQTIIRILGKSNYFDRNYYLSMYPDVLSSGIDPVEHYFIIGWKEGRNPSNEFDTNFYLSTYQDVYFTGICPLYHFIEFGEKEGRLHKSQPLNIDGLRSKKNDPTVFRLKVSVIVPNFNHDRFLEKRLSSIYNQTFPNFEVILLDDCSSDSSLNILTKFQKNYPEITRLLVNEKNSGGVFYQWEKGISLAEGELIWIAESDDFCDEDFLEKLVPYFEDEAVLLGYAHSIFVNDQNQKINFSFESYLSEISTSKWKSSYVKTAHHEVIEALGIKNSIPNVSSVVFRRPRGNFQLFEDLEWLKMKICGDWIFYLNLIHGGKIAYCQETNNYFRFHDDNSSAKTHQSDIYYEEHEQVASCLASLYRVPNDILKRNFQIIRNFYYQHIENATDEKLSSLYNIEKVLATKQNRLPNILMVIYAFSTGGAEIGSIRLANELKEKGVAITTLIGNFMPRNPGVRNMLDPQVPVINYAQNTDLSLLVREFGIEVIHTNHASLEYLIANFASKEGDKFIHVATMHGMYEMMSNFEIDAKRYIDRIDHWFYIADKNLIPFKKYGYYLEDKFTKVNNGMRFDQMNPIDRKELGITGDSFVVCLASRAFAEKGWREAIKAISAAREITKKEIHLLLLGEGIVYEELVLDQLPDYIHLMGNKYNVIDYFGGSDVGLLPSYFLGESVPLAIIECLAAGKPVIASDIGEIPNMITDANNNMAGIIVKLEKGSLVIDDLTSAIVRMATDQEFYNRCANSAKEVREKFSISPVTDVYISCYKKLAFSNISSSK